VEQPPPEGCRERPFLVCDELLPSTHFGFRYASVRASA
jgi:hypothetical protein